METIYLITYIVIAASLLILAAVAVIRLYFKRAKRAIVEGRFLPESKRIIWRFTNKADRNITLVEIGIECNGVTASYRPLFASDEEINNIPCTVGTGEIASYRKEIERFVFPKNQIESLKILNPYIRFYLKDAEGKMYFKKSEIKFAQFITDYQPQ